MMSHQPPPIETHLKMFVQNKYQRNISLGQLNKDERELTRYFCLQNELIHNIPRDSSQIGQQRKENEIFVWKPNKSEKDFFFILHQFLKSPEFILIYYQEVHEFDRFVAHYVADSIGLEHKSFDTPQGRRLTFWKPKSKSFSLLHENVTPLQDASADFQMPPTILRDFSDLPRSNTLSGPLSRSDTWTPNSSYGPEFQTRTFEDKTTVEINEEVNQKNQSYLTSESSVGHEKAEPILPISMSPTPITSPVAPPVVPPVVPSMSLPIPISTDSQGTARGETKHIDYDNVPEGSPLSRQVSRRVINEVNELREKVNSLSQFERITTGTGEVYLVRDNGTGERAIFKPAAQLSQSKRSSSTQSSILESKSSKSFSDDDCEAITSYSSQSEEVQSDEIVTHRKEVAAYQLDHFGFAGVLPTMESEVQISDDPSVGMIQQYLAHDKTADEDVIGLTEINLLPVREVHKIGLLDIRLFNEDRHGGNLLLDQKEGTGAAARLVPIDHELTLPHWRHLQNATFCWMSWKQASKPLDEKHLTYIRELDIDRDVSLLRSLDIPPPSVATYIICCNFLKMAAEMGLHLNDMANIMVRFPDYPYNDKYGPLEQQPSPCLEDTTPGPDQEEPSTLEKLICLAKRTCGDGDELSDFFGVSEVNRFKFLLKEYLQAMLSARVVTPCAHEPLSISHNQSNTESNLKPSPSFNAISRNLEGHPLQKVSAVSE